MKIHGELISHYIINNVERKKDGRKNTPTAPEFRKRDET